MTAVTVLFTVALTHLLLDLQLAECHYESIDQARKLGGLLGGQLAYGVQTNGVMSDTPEVPAGYLCLLTRTILMDTLKQALPSISQHFQMYSREVQAVVGATAMTVATQLLCEHRLLVHTRLDEAMSLGLLYLQGGEPVKSSCLPPYYHVPQSHQPLTTHLLSWEAIDVHHLQQWVAPHVEYEWPPTPCQHTRPVDETVRQDYTFEEYDERDLPLYPEPEDRVEKVTEVPARTDKCHGEYLKLQQEGTFDFWRLLAMCSRTKTTTTPPPTTTTTTTLIPKTRKKKCSRVKTTTMPTTECQTTTTTTTESPLKMLLENKLREMVFKPPCNPATTTTTTTPNTPCAVKAENVAQKTLIYG